MDIHYINCNIYMVTALKKKPVLFISLIKLMNFIALKIFGEKYKS